jgi:hypothetical protein
MIWLPSGRTTMVCVSPPTCRVWISRAPKRNRSSSSCRMNDWPLGSRMMMRPGSVKTVRPPSWVSRRALRKSSSRRGPCTVAPGAIGVRACAGRGMVGSGALTVGGGPRRASGAAPGGSAVWPPPGAAFGAAFGAPLFGTTEGRGGVAGLAGDAGGGGGAVCVCGVAPDGRLNSLAPGGGVAGLAGSAGGAGGAVCVCGVTPDGRLNSLTPDGGATGAGALFCCGCTDG